MRLRGKVALVTGSAQGIGRSIAATLAREGAIVVVADVNEPGAKAVADTIVAAGGEASAIRLDVADAADAKNGVLAAADRGNGRLDILVNNAGINRDVMLHKMSQEQWNSVIQVDLTGVFNCLQPAAVLMREQNYGRIVNISSASWQGNIGQANYSAAKAGVVGLTKAAAKELARYRVTVNAVCPGFIDTEMTRRVPAPVHDLMISKIPLGRIGEPEEVANVVAFLASDEASYVTEEVIHVGGGFKL